MEDKREKPCPKGNAGRVDSRVHAIRALVHLDAGRSLYVRAPSYGTHLDMHKKGRGAIEAGGFNGESTLLIARLGVRDRAWC